MYNFDNVIKPKFIGPKHSEVKQTETSEFGTNKGLLQGQARRTDGSCSKDPNSPMGVREQFIEAKLRVRGTEFMTFS